jgi:hypothetical protein
LHSRYLAQDDGRKTGAIPLADGRATAEVGEREGGGAVAPVCGTEDREQSGILRNRKQLALAELVAAWGEVSCEEEDGAEKRLTCHVSEFSFFLIKTI